LILEDLMLLTGSRWTVAFGAYTLGAQLKTDDLESAASGAYTANSIPAHPDKEMKISSPCGLLDPNKPPTFHPMLDGNGNSWVAFGVRQLSNAPNPAIVEALFRQRAEEQFGTAWDLTKKKRLNGLRKAVKNEVADKTPFRLVEFGAVFVCLGSGEIISAGNAGVIVAKDLVGRIDALSRVAFAASSPDTGGLLLAYLRRQSEKLIPWPTGTVSLRRKRKKENESCSVKMMGWTQDSQDAADILLAGWKPVRIEVMWGEEGQKKVCERGTVGMTGRLESVSWGDKIGDSDPCVKIEARMGHLLVMDAEVRHGLQASGSATPLPLDS
jgi:hypothetical protein